MNNVLRLQESRQALLWGFDNKPQRGFFTARRDLSEAYALLTRCDFSSAHFVKAMHLSYSVRALFQPMHPFIDMQGSLPLIRKVFNRSVNGGEVDIDDLENLLGVGLVSILELVGREHVKPAIEGLDGELDSVFEAIEAIIVNRPDPHRLQSLVNPLPLNSSCDAVNVNACAFPREFKGDIRLMGLASPYDVDKLVQGLRATVLANDEDMQKVVSRVDDVRELGRDIDSVLAEASHDRTYVLSLISLYEVLNHIFYPIAGRVEKDAYGIEDCVSEVLGMMGDMIATVPQEDQRTAFNEVMNDLVMRLETVARISRDTDVAVPALWEEFSSDAVRRNRRERRLVQFVQRYFDLLESANACEVIAEFPSRETIARVERQYDDLIALLG